MKQYASLHNHTDYSNASLGFIDSIITLPLMRSQAEKLGFSAVAITDHECLSGHVQAIKTFKDSQVKLILGNEIYLAREDLIQTNYEKGEKFFHMILLAKNKRGHEALRKLSTLAWERSFKRVIMRRYNIDSDFDNIMKEYKGDLVVTTACLGNRLNHFLQTLPEQQCLVEIEKEIQKLENWFGAENTYIEIAPALQTGDQAYYNRFMTTHFSKYNFIVATDSHYGHKEEFTLFDIILNSKSSKDRDTQEYYSTSHLMEWTEIETMFSNVEPNLIEQARLNTLKIAEQCEVYDLEQPARIPYINIKEQETLKTLPLFWEKYSSIVDFYKSENLSDRHLLWQIVKGYDKFIVEYNEEVLERINLELYEIWNISKTLKQSLSNYLITMGKIIHLIWEEADSIVGPSRGSAGAFIINYLIGITQWNPLKYDMEMPHWRFISADRPDLPDIDVDTPGAKRSEVLLTIANYFEKEVKGRVVQVSAFKTETTKAAIKTAAKALQIEDATANYASSLIGNVRGSDLTFKQTYYGDPENEINPNKKFIELINSVPLWKEVIERILGLVVGLSAHAAGVLLCNEPIHYNNSIMKTNSGILVSAFDLHDSEYLGYVKYDFLSVDGLGKLQTALYFMLQDNIIEWKGSLYETYMYYLNPNTLKYSEEMWDQMANSEINSLWQFDTVTGKSAMEFIQPRKLSELGIANSLMRLQPQTKHEVQPMETYVQFKKDIELWYSELRSFRLTQEEIAILEKHLLHLSGVADTQEAIMLLSMDKNIANFNVVESNKLRKGIAKKSIKAQSEARDLFYEKGKEVGTSKNMLDYVWNVQVRRQLGYSFSLPHVAAYSMIAVQQANLYSFYPKVYWNTACLASDAYSNVEEDFADLIKKGYIQIPVAKRLRLTEEILNFMSDEEIEDMEEMLQEVYENDLDEDEKSNVAIDRGKIASSLSKYQQSFKITAPNINKSGYNFKPDKDNNTIVCGLKIVAKLGTPLIAQILQNRPYSSLTDFTSRVKISIDRVANLIKAGAFDEIEPTLTRHQMIKRICVAKAGVKEVLNLRNAQKLFEKDLIPKEYEINKKVFNWYKYVTKKANKISDTLYLMDERALNFHYQQGFDFSYIKDVEFNSDYVKAIEKSRIKAIYDDYMVSIKDFIAKNQEELLCGLNEVSLQDVYKKYVSVNDAEGEMQSMRVYLSENPLSKVNFKTVEISNFQELEDSETIGDFTTDKGVVIPIYKISNIIGTVIDKNKLKNTVTLLTTGGPVTIKLWKDTFSLFNKKNVAYVGNEKVVTQPSFLDNGTHLILCGFRRGETFVLKKYKNQGLDHVLMKLHLDENNNARPEVKCE